MLRPVDVVSVGPMGESQTGAATVAEGFEFVGRGIEHPGVKYAMDQRGYRGGVPRLPLQPLSAEQMSRVDAFLRTLGQPVTASG